MSENTKIEWADHTFNPWEGCQKVGPGCDNCYAEARNARFAGGTAINWGPGAPRRRTSVSNWNKPRIWNLHAAQFLAEHGRRQRVFCASLADVFDNQVSPAWREDLWALIDATPNLDWLILTKRIGIVAPWVALYGWPANAWLGATIVNQEEADRDIPKLLEIPVPKRFLSMEPLLGPVDLRFMDVINVMLSRVGTGIDWVIVGGESGPGSRPMHPDWVRGLRDQCLEARVSFLFKQWGEWSPGNQAPHLSNAFAAKKLFQFLEYNGCEVGTFKAGKKESGRLLDGREWNEVPA